MKEEIVKLVDRNLEELYNSLMDKPLQVLSIFNNFFGEDRVDMQGYLSLDEFKSQITGTAIDDYIPNKDMVGMSIDDWHRYRRESITDIPNNQARKVADALTKIETLEFISSGYLTYVDILVHFPHVRVTNEYGKFVDINHLWAKLAVSYDGTLYGRFALNRSEYPILHISNNYMHSHISGIPSHDFTQFQFPCTGTGPINNTITTLNREYDEDIWNMFCLELSKYVTVESIAGRPYRLLERLSVSNRIYDDFVTQIELSHYIIECLGYDYMKKFIRYFINLKKLKFSYKKGYYSIGMSFTEYIVLISNEFIRWYNYQFNKGELSLTFREMIDNTLLRRGVISNGKIYIDSEAYDSSAYTRYIGEKVCTFKGKEILLTITEIVEVDELNQSIFLNINIALYILIQILKVLNYRYGRSKDIIGTDKDSTEVRYL